MFFFLTDPSGGKNLDLEYISANTDDSITNALIIEILVYRLLYFTLIDY